MTRLRLWEAEGKLWKLQRYFIHMTGASCGTGIAVCSGWMPFEEDQIMTSSKQIITRTIIVGVFALFAGCATSGTQFVVLSAVVDSGDDLAGNVIDIEGMTGHLLQERQLELDARFGELVSDARDAVERRQHRVAYLKYRDIKRVLDSSIAILSEVKRRETTVSSRVEMARKIDKVQERVGEVKRMLSLLDFSSRS
jgi:hypothetical protein